MPTMLGNRSNRNLEDAPELYDESLGYDDETGIKFAPGLTAIDRTRATIIYRLFNELWGLCIVTGDPGTGKDTFCNYITYLIKTYFSWKRILRDERPRALYGPYAGLFTEELIIKDLKSMKRIAKGKKPTEAEEAEMDRSIDDWLKGAGEVLMKNSVVYLTEYWKYCGRLESTSPMCKTMGGIHRLGRHLDCLVFGSVQDPQDLARQQSLRWVNWQVVCTKSSFNITGFNYYVYKMKYDKRVDKLLPTPVNQRPFRISLDAGRPRKELGDGKIVIRKPDYQPENEEEKIILDVIKSGLNVYEDIVELLTTQGDFTEKEVGDTIKKLGLKLPGFRPKMVLDYPCYFKIYNSKSAVALSSNIKFEE
jgi:hypothetical protein